MKNSIAFFLVTTLLMPRYSLAWCDNPDAGASRMFNVAIYTVSGCNPNKKFRDGTKIIAYTPLDKHGKPVGETQAVRMDDECKTMRNRAGFSCTKNGRSPLAGASYIVTRDMKDVCDESGKTLVNRLTCLKGCESGKAPIYIESSPWEC